MRSVSLQYHLPVATYETDTIDFGHQQALDFEFAIGVKADFGRDRERAAHRKFPTQMSSIENPKAT